MYPRPFGVIHVGAHHAEEYSTYRHYGVVNILMFEPLPESFKIAEKVAEDAVVENFALGNENCWVDLNVPDKHNASSSILKPKLHLEQYPDILFERTVEVMQLRLDNYLSMREEKKYDTLVMDAQGYELEVLKGAVRTLESSITSIYTEVNREELYENCAMVQDVDKFLAKFGFERIITEWLEETWGNAVYFCAKEKPA